MSLLVEMPAPAPAPAAVVGGLHVSTSFTVESGLKKRTHRRAASVPPPIDIETSSDEDIEQGSIQRPEPKGTIFTKETISSNAESDSLMSHTNSEVSTMSQSGSENSFISLVEIPELVQSPTHNRRSIIEWDFNELPLDTNSSPGMTSAFLNKFLRHSPSSESIEKEDRRPKILNEIVTTEQRYISCMKILIDLFLPSLEEIMAPDDLRYLFPWQLESMIELHDKLLERLMEGIAQWKGIVGDVFGRLWSDKQGEFIALYSAYMNDFKTAMTTLARYEHTSPLFCKTARTCSQDPRCEGLSLASFLLTPVQRLPRYELLLKELLKHTPQNHPDNYSLEMALDSIHSNIQMLDASIQECQIACSVGRVKKDKKSGRKSNRRKRHNSSSRFGQIRRHLSQASIDDFRRSRSSETQAYSNSMGKSVGNLAVSVENLSDKMRSRDSQATLANSRAISFSNVLLLDFEDTSDGHPQLLQENVEEAEEREVETVTLLEDDKDTSLALEYDKDTSSEPEEKEDDGDKPRSCTPSSDMSIPIIGNPRASIYSTNSSTSGFGSLGRDEDYRSNEGEDVGTLRHMEALNSFDSGYPEEKYESHSTVTLRPKKEKKLFASALKVFRRKSKDASINKVNHPLSKHKRSSSMNHVNKYEISDPSNFVHLQHGYGGRPLSMVLS